MTAQRYKAQLHEAGMAGTRAVAITEAISELHKAFAACDVTNRNIVRDLFGNLTVDQMITRRRTPRGSYLFDGERAS